MSESCLFVTFISKRPKPHKHLYTLNSKHSLGLVGQLDGPIEIDLAGSGAVMNLGRIGHSGIACTAPGLGHLRRRHCPDFTSAFDSGLAAGGADGGAAAAGADAAGAAVGAGGACGGGRSTIGIHKHSETRSHEPMTPIAMLAAKSSSNNMSSTIACYPHSIGSLNSSSKYSYLLFGMQQRSSTSCA